MQIETYADSYFEGVKALWQKAFPDDPPWELHRRRGIATALVEAAENRLRERGCVKINLQVRSSNAAAVAFYTRLGYAIEERVSMGKRLGEIVQT